MDELALIKEFPLEALDVYLQAEKARTSVLKYFPKDGEDDESDAFRHFVWAGLLSQSLGPDLAKRFLDAHESDGLKSHDLHYKQASEMDTANNRTALEAAEKLKAQDALTWSAIEQDGQKALNEGRLSVLKPKK